MHPRLAIALLAVTDACLWGCAAAPSGAYATANAACATLAVTKAQAELCVGRVQEVWCGDGGLWTTTDAGQCAATKDGAP